MLSFGEEFFNFQVSTYFYFTHYLNFITRPSIFVFKNSGIIKLIHFLKIIRGSINLICKRITNKRNFSLLKPFADFVMVPTLSNPSNLNNHVSWIVDLKLWQISNHNLEISRSLTNNCCPA